jgi:hypothetical protein
MFDDMMGGNDSDEMDLMDFDALAAPKKGIHHELDFHMPVPEKRFIRKTTTLNF